MFFEGSDFRFPLHSGDQKSRHDRILNGRLCPVLNGVRISNGSFSLDCCAFENRTFYHLETNLQNVRCSNSRISDTRLKRIFCLLLFINGPCWPKHILTDYLAVLWANLIFFNVLVLKICLIMPRLYDFNRSIEDMVKVVKLHESTLRKRLNEFGATTTALLTLGKGMIINYVTPFLRFSDPLLYALRQIPYLSELRNISIILRSSIM